LDWEQFTQMPSRKTVAAVEQEERDRLLAEAATKGFVTNYVGVRTSSTGKRFYIEDTILWNVLDEQNNGVVKRLFSPSTRSSHKLPSH
jgi:hypothetical protein